MVKLTQAPQKGVLSKENIPQHTVFKIRKSGNNDSPTHKTYNGEDQEATGKN